VDFVPLRSDWSQQSCPIARSLDVLGDPWVLLIAREAFRGVTRFADFRTRLKIADNVLSKRLQLMTEAGLLARRECAGDHRAVDYVLTEAGADLLPVLHSLSLWGAKHAASERPGSELEIIHRDCGQVSASADHCSTCGEELRPDNVEWRHPGRSPRLERLVGAGGPGDSPG
jgi:DNA-binding HxlR family transcriptional regulator